MSLTSLKQKINAVGFSITANQIISAPQVTLLYLRREQPPVCPLLLAEDVKKDFAEFNQSNTAADHIVFEDIGKAWSYLTQELHVNFNGQLSRRFF